MFSFNHSMQDYIKMGKTAEEWRQDGQTAYDAIVASPHFHNWVPCEKAGTACPSNNRKKA